MRHWRTWVVVALVLGTVLSPFAVGWSAGEKPPPAVKVDPAVVKKVEWELRTFARKLAQEGTLDKDSLFALLSNYLWKNPEIFGAAVALIPEKKNGKEIKTAPFVYRKGDLLIQKDLIDSFDYTAPDQKWYAAPARLGKPIWSEPYYDKGGGEVWMVTYSVPIFSAGKEARLIAIATSDVLVAGE